MDTPASTIQKVEVYKISNGCTYDTLEEAEYQEARIRLASLCDDVIVDTAPINHRDDLLDALTSRPGDFLAALSDYQNKRQVWEAEQARVEAEASAQVTSPVRSRRKRS